MWMVIVSVNYFVNSNTETCHIVSCLCRYASSMLKKILSVMPMFASSASVETTKWWQHFLPFVFI